MAFTRIADVIVPEVYADQVNSELSTNKDALVASGAVAADALLGAELSGGFSAAGHSIIIPSWKAFDVTDTVGSDNPADVIDTNARTQVSMKASKLFRTFSFDATDVARYVAAGDPLGDSALQAAKNVMTNRQRALTQTLVGVKADNVANNGADMVTTVNRITGTAVIDGDNRLSRDVVLDAQAQRGDFGSSPTVAIVMHSAVYYQLMKDDASSFERPSDQQSVTLYLGIPVIVDDSMPTTTIATATRYTTALLGAGSVRLASSGVTAAVDRDEKMGNGFGVESLITRRIDIIHPEGFDYTGADNSANSVLAVAASWTRRFERKNVGISFVDSNVS